MPDIYTHADGDTYALIDPDTVLKDPSTGEWIPAVTYVGLDGRARTTTRKRWDERFTLADPQPPAQVWAPTTTMMLRHFPENPATPRHLRPNAMMTAAADRIDALENLAKQAHMWLTLFLGETDVDPDETAVKISITSRDGGRDEPVTTLTLSKTMAEIASLFGGSMPASSMMTEATTNPDEVDIEL